MNEKEYRAYDAINYSLLKALDEHPRKAYKMLYTGYKFNSSSMTYGSLLDCLLTNPDEFDELFYICDYAPDPETNEGKLFEKLKEEYPDFIFTKDDVILIADKNKLWGNIKSLETKLKKVDSFGFWDHISIIKENIDKQQVTNELYTKARSAKVVLETHEFTSRFFQAPYSIDFQKAIIFNYNGHECKILIDMLVWNHIQKTVRVVDLKTLFGYQEFFMENFRKYKYDIQGVHYHNGVVEYVKENEEYKDYNVLMPMFMISSSSNIEEPVVFELSKKDYDTRNVGGYDKYGREIKSVNKLCDELQWHKNTGRFSYYKKTYDNLGVIQTNLY